MNGQPDRVERVSIYDGSDEQRLELVKTIVAMANTGGGRVEIGRVEGGRDELEARGLAEIVNRFVAPRLRGLESEAGSDGGVRVSVCESQSTPHVFTRDGVCQRTGRSLFSTGQIWVRCQGHNQPAGGEDVGRMVREAASRFLERLSIGVRDPAFSLKLTESAGIPVHLAEEEESVPVSPNLARLYPYTTKTLAARLGKPMNWVATAVKVLRLKESREQAYGVPAPSGRVIQWRYSEQALGTILDQLKQQPAWNPYHAP